MNINCKVCGPIKANRRTCHCTGCHKTFGGVSGFDRHCRTGRCLRSDELIAAGLTRDERGWWVLPRPDAFQREIRQSRQRRGRAVS